MRMHSTHESLPSLTRRVRCLYVGMGDEPVGRPSTKGLSGVGRKSVILARSEGRVRIDWRMSAADLGASPVSP